MQSIPQPEKTIFKKLHKKYEKYGLTFILHKIIKNQKIRKKNEIVEIKEKERKKEKRRESKEK